MLNLVKLFAALSDPTRLRLLSLMKDGELCVCYLQGVLKTNQPKISRHLAYLRNAGLVTARRDGKWMNYSLKKLEGEQRTILLQTLARLEKEPQIKSDRKRLKEICCQPARFGVSSPSDKGE